MIAGLSLMVAIHAFDLIPNATTEGYLTLLSGALAGAVPGILREQSLRDAQRRAAASGSEPGSGPGTGSGARPRRPGETPPTLAKSLLGPPSTRRPKR